MVFVVDGGNPLISTGDLDFWGMVVCGYSTIRKSSEIYCGYIDPVQPVKATEFNHGVNSGAFSIYGFNILIG